MKRHLVIVDLQHDFIRGSMAVQGAEAVVPRIAEMIPGCRRVTFTLDWHPADHCSFVDRGGMWPSHCVAYTVGAGIPSEVVSAAASHTSHCSFVLKGRDAGREEYGAFSSQQLYDDTFAGDGCDEVLFVGLCGDYCVGQSIRNFVRFDGGRHRAALSTGGICSIDDGTTLRDTIGELGLTVYK